MYGTRLGESWLGERGAGRIREGLEKKNGQNFFGRRGGGYDGIWEDLGFLMYQHFTANMMIPEAEDTENAKLGLTIYAWI